MCPAPLKSYVDLFIYLSDTASQPLFIVVGLVKDESSLSDLKITSGAKMMVIGSTISDVITVQTPLSSNSKVEPEAITFGKLSYNWCKPHGPVFIPIIRPLLELCSEIKCNRLRE